jgi:hypothetical protein
LTDAEELRERNSSIANFELPKAGTLVAMTSNYDLDDVEGFPGRIDRKAAILFRKRAGVAPLYVKRTFLKDVEQNGKTVNCVRNQPVESLSEIAGLRKVQYLSFQ